MKFDKIIYLKFIHFVIYGIFFVSFETYGFDVLVLGALLLIISLSDFQSYEIPDVAVLVLTLTGVTVTLSTATPLVLKDRAVATVFWPIIFFSIGIAHNCIRGHRGLGLGDVKLIAALGPWLGFIGVNYTVLIAAFAAILFLLCKQSLGRLAAPAITVEKVPFGSFLCFAAWVVYLRSDVI